jgi:hypothetical protein
LPIGPGEDVGVYRVDVAVVVDDPVTPFCALLPSPFPIDKTVDIQQETDGSNWPIGAAKVEGAMGSHPLSIDRMGLT